MISTLYPEPDPPPVWSIVLAPSGVWVAERPGWIVRWRMVI